MTIEAVRSWLLEPQVGQLPPGQLIAGLAERLDAQGFQLVRIAQWLSTLHPEAWGSHIVWNRESGVKVIERLYDTMQTPTFVGSPGEAMYRGESPLRVRLDVPRESYRFPVLAEVADQGATDYLGIGLPPSGWIAFASGRKGGFTESDLAAFKSLEPLLSLHGQLASARSETRSLLEVYLGPNAAQHVLGGQFRRGTATAISAAVWFCDLRGFTGLGDRLPPRELVGVLNRYFEAVAAAVEKHGGEILKLIGDAALAIFPVAEAGACRRALAAAEDALASVAKLDGLKMGIGLHVGDVMYGNIGGRRRLDFTVIGATVNEVSRVESLCKTLGAPLLMTGTFVRELEGVETRLLGSHVLRGVSEPQEIYTLKRL